MLCLVISCASVAVIGHHPQDNATARQFRSGRCLLMTESKLTCSTSTRCSSVFRKVQEPRLKEAAHQKCCSDSKRNKNYGSRTFLLSVPRDFPRVSFLETTYA